MVAGAIVHYLAIITNLYFWQGLLGFPHSSALMTIQTKLLVTNTAAIKKKSSLMQNIHDEMHMMERALISAHEFK